MLLFKQFCLVVILRFLQVKNEKSEIEKEEITGVKPNDPEYIEVKPEIVYNEVSLQFFQLD